MDYKWSLKWAWLRHVTHFGGPVHISGVAEATAVKFGTQVGYIKSYQKNKKTRSSAIAEGPHEVLVSRNPATTKHLN